MYTTFYCFSWTKKYIAHCVYSIKCKLSSMTCKWQYIRQVAEMKTRDLTPLIQELFIIVIHFKTTNIKHNFERVMVHVIFLFWEFTCKSLILTSFSFCKSNETKCCLEFVSTFTVSACERG